MKHANFLQTWKYLRLMATKEWMQQMAMELFIRGSYKREWKEGEVFMTETVHLTMVSSVADVYEVQKMTRSVQAMPGGKTRTETDPPVKWSAVYHRGSRQLAEIGGHRQCSFLPEQELLLVGTVRYKKIKK